MIRITEKIVEKCYPKHDNIFKRKLADLIINSDFRGKISSAVVKELSEYLKTDMNGVMKELLYIAKAFANTPISNLYIGAVARDIEGNLYLGANMEFPGGDLGHTIHAEVSAILNAFTNNADKISILAIDYAPCGDCRQFMRELVNAYDLEILVSHQPAIFIKDLLPMSFGPSELGNSNGLFSKEIRNLMIANQNEVNELSRAALEAAIRSYAPYTKRFAAVGIRATDGKIYAAPYVENVAFNPSYSPMRSALNYFNISNRTYNEIGEAVLVEYSNDEKSWFESSSVNLLSLVNPNVRLKTIKLNLQ